MHFTRWCDDSDRFQYLSSGTACSRLWLLITMHMSASTITGKTLVDCLTLLPTSAHHLSILHAWASCIPFLASYLQFVLSQIDVVAGLDECVVLPAARLGSLFVSFPLPADFVTGWAGVLVCFFVSLLLLLLFFLLFLHFLFALHFCWLDPSISPPFHYLHLRILFSFSTIFFSSSFFTSYCMEYWSRWCRNQLSAFLMLERRLVICIHGRSWWMLSILGC